MAIFPTTPVLVNTLGRRPVSRFSDEEVLRGEGASVSQRGAFNDFQIVYLDTVSPTNHYYGFLDVAGNYYIQQELLSSSGNIGTYKFYLVKGSGNSGLTTDWTNRASLSYAFIDQLGI